MAVADQLSVSNTEALKRPSAPWAISLPGHMTTFGRGGRRFKSCHSDQHLAEYMFY